MAGSHRPSEPRTLGCSVSGSKAEGIRWSGEEEDLLDLVQESDVVAFHDLAKSGGRKLRACRHSSRVDAIALPRVVLPTPVTTGHPKFAASVAAADELYTRNAPLLRYIALTKFHVPREDVDGLVHDVFATYLASPTPVRSPRPYLIGAICNAARHYWREKKNEEAALSKCEVVLSPDDELIVDVVGRKLLIASTLSRIGSKCRDLLRRYYLDGESTSAIASTRETTTDYVLFLLHRCRKNARAVVRSLLS